MIEGSANVCDVICDYAVLRKPPERQYLRKTPERQYFA